MNWPHSLTDSRIQILKYFQKSYRVENCHSYRSRCLNERKISKDQIFVYQSIEKNKEKSILLYVSESYY